jgi:hypothetical protein
MKIAGYCEQMEWRDALLRYKKNDLEVTKTQIKS